MATFDVRKDVESQRKQQREIAEAFEVMVNSKGWAFFEEYLKREEAYAVAQMSTIKDGETALMAVVSLATMQKLRQYPSQQVAMVAALEKSP